VSRYELEFYEDAGGDQPVLRWRLTDTVGSGVGLWWGTVTVAASQPRGCLLNARTAVGEATARVPVFA